MGRRKWRQIGRPELSEIHARKCLAWAREYEFFKPEYWARVRWSDECTVERGAGIQPIWTFRRPSEHVPRFPSRRFRKAFCAFAGNDSGELGAVAVGPGSLGVCVSGGPGLVGS